MTTVALAATLTVNTCISSSVKNVPVKEKSAAEATPAHKPKAATNVAMRYKYRMRMFLRVRTVICLQVARLVQI